MIESHRGPSKPERFSARADKESGSRWASRSGSNASLSEKKSTANKRCRRYLCSRSILGVPGVLCAVRGVSPISPDDSRKTKPPVVILKLQERRMILQEWRQLWRITAVDDPEQTVGGEASGQRPGVSGSNGSVQGVPRGVQVTPSKRSQGRWPAGRTWSSGSTRSWRKAGRRSLTTMVESTTSGKYRLCTHSVFSLVSWCSRSFLGVLARFLVFSLGVLARFSVLFRSLVYTVQARMCIIVPGLVLCARAHGVVPSLVSSCLCCCCCGLVLLFLFALLFVLSCLCCCCCSWSCCSCLCSLVVLNCFFVVVFGVCVCVCVCARAHVCCYIIPTLDALDHACIFDFYSCTCSFIRACSFDRCIRVNVLIILHVSALDSCILVHVFFSRSFSL